MTIPPWANDLDVAPLIPSWGSSTASEAVAELSLRWGRRSVQFTVFYCDLATPKRLEGVIATARHSAPKRAVLVVAPYLSPTAWVRLAETGVSGADRSGNTRLEVPDLLLIERLGRPNCFPASAGIRNPFAGRTGLVAMTLLSAPTPLTPGALRQRASHTTPISAATVSKALNALEEEDLIVRSRERVDVVSRDRLFEALAARVPPPRIERRLRTRLRLDTAVARVLAHNAEQSETRWGVETTLPWVAYPAADQSITIWTTNIEGLLGTLPHDIDHPFSDVVLTETTNVELFHDLRPGVLGPSLSPLVLALLLRARGARARAVAEALREVVLEPVST